MAIADKLVLQRQRHLKWQSFDRLDVGKVRAELTRQGVRLD